MGSFFNGFSFVEIQDGGEVVTPFARKLNFIGADSVQVGAGADADQVNITLPSGGSLAAISGAQLSLGANDARNETGVQSWDTEDFDLGGWADLGADDTILTVPAGITHVRCGAQLVFDQNVTGDMLLLTQLNGGNVGRGIGQVSLDHVNGATMRAQVVTGFIAVSEGDTLRIQSQGPDTSITVLAGLSWFYAEGFNFA